MIRKVLIPVFEFAWRFGLVYALSVLVIVLTGTNRQWQLGVLGAFVMGTTIAWFLDRGRHGVGNHQTKGQSDGASEVSE